VDEIGTESASSESVSTGGQLPAYFDVLLDGNSLRDIESERVVVHEKKRLEGDLAKKLVERNVFIGRTERAIELLLETAPDNPEFQLNYLKACVMSASISPEVFSHTVKLVATNLIANSLLDEGVQLLCLVGKGLDACRYLQGYDRWIEAAALAKTLLPENECAVVMRRWAQFLINSKQKPKAIEILLTLGEFQTVLKLLHEVQRDDTAALFATALGQVNLLPNNEGGVDTDLADISLDSVLEGINLDFGITLQKVGCVAGSVYYWQKAGGNGNALIEKLKH